MSPEDAARESQWPSSARSGGTGLACPRWGPSGWRAWALSPGVFPTPQTSEAFAGTGGGGFC